MNDRRHAPDLGDVIGGCRLERVIGRGGMGIVYLAEQEALGRKVAVKVIAPGFAEDIGFRQRFERESHLAAAIDHPNIVPVYSAGEDDGRLYIVMHFVKGTDLRGILTSEGALAPDRAARIITDIGGALDAAHASGLVHRDVKPGNVLLSYLPSGERAYLSDFGLTKNAASQSGLTLTGQWVGTLDYIAPEQLERGTADARVDIYALGCVLFETVAGEVPYPGTDVQKLWAHVNQPPPSLANSAPAVAPALDPVIQRAMAKNPEERFGSAGDLARAAAAALGGSVPLRSQETVASGAAVRTVAAGRIPASPGGETRAAQVPAPEPPHAPQAASGAARAGNRRPLIAVAAVLVVAGVAAAVLLAGGGGGGGGDGDDGGQDEQVIDAPSLEVSGTSKNDDLKGTAGDDVVSAGAGDDTVDALAGNDQIDGGEGADNLAGGAGDDEFVDSEDDAIDVMNCGAGQDLVAKPDTRDILHADCEKAGWTAQRLGTDAFENRITVAAKVAGDTVSFEGTCQAACAGSIDLRTPTDRRLLGEGSFEIGEGESGPISATLNGAGRTYVQSGRNVRVVLRVGAVDSGFTTPIGS